MKLPLTILTISNLEDRTQPLRDEMRDLADRLDAEFVEWDGRGAGILEHVLDQAVAECDDGYILLLADDERCSDQMADWLEQGSYLTHDHWALPRAHLWEDEEHYILDPPLWPDLQTRLSVKAKSGGRHRVHQGSPHGTGEIADVAIEHHKFLLYTPEERAEILEFYKTLDPRAGNPHFVAFSLPNPAHVEPWHGRHATSNERSTAWASSH